MAVVVAAAPNGDLMGQQVATLMGGLGRVFDGGYAEKELGATVIATTRPDDRVQTLRDRGARDVVVENGEIAGRELGLVSVVWTWHWNSWASRPCPTPCRPRAYTEACVSPGCCQSMAGAGFLPDPLHPPRCPAYCYGGGSADLPADELQNYLDRIASGVVSLGHSNSHGLEDFRQAHSDLENNRAVGKCVVLTYPKRVKALRATCPRSCPQTVGEPLHGF